MSYSEATARTVAAAVQGGESMRSVARRLGISRATVAAMVRRGPKGWRVSVSRRLDDLEWLAEWERRPFERCPGCGRMVRMPCIACRVDPCRFRV